MSEDERFGHYVVYECLGAGGMATVHRATIELEDGSTLEVALKRLLPQLAQDRRFVEDFIREAKLASQLAHPNIIRILELGRVNRTYFIAMELVRGQPLMALMRRAHLQKRPASIPAVISLVVELCDALAYAHESVDELGNPRRIIHRDLTPSNLLVADDGHLKIIDFGVAKALSGQFMTNSGLAKGKLGYMSAEAIAGTVDARSDVFAAGVVMWELLAGRRLFKAKNEYDVIVKIREGDIKKPSEHRPDCPSELDDIVMRALARDRDARWPSASAMGEALVDLRRYYQGKAYAGEVARWKQRLRADSSPLVGRIDSDAETTVNRLSSSDLIAHEEPDELGEGSRREDYEVPSESQAYDDVRVDIGPSEVFVPDEGPRGKFVEADTIVSIVSFLDRPGRAPTPSPASRPQTEPDNPFTGTPDTDTEIPPEK